MRVVVKKPGYFSAPMQIENEAEDLQRLVDGPIICVPFAADGKGYWLAYNADSKFRALEPNILHEGEVIPGTVVVVGRDRDGFADIEVKEVRAINVELDADMIWLQRYITATTDTSTARREFFS